MDNYFQDTPALMSDGRLYTDYRSSQVREKYFEYKNCIGSENEANTLRSVNGNQMMDDEWKYLTATKLNVPRQVFFHTSPTTRTTTAFNMAEINAYNTFNLKKINEYIPSPNDLQPPAYDLKCKDQYRMTTTPDFEGRREACGSPGFVGCGYPDAFCPKSCKNGSFVPDGVRNTVEA